MGITMLHVYQKANRLTQINNVARTMRRSDWADLEFFQTMTDPPTSKNNRLIENLNKFRLGRLGKLSGIVLVICYILKYKFILSHSDKFRKLYFL